MIMGRAVGGGRGRRLSTGTVEPQQGGLTIDRTLPLRSATVPRDLCQNQSSDVHLCGT